jgi:co-chaperonin GroES (HSP10)
VKDIVKIVPLKNQIIGIGVEITMTVSGIVLPDQQGMKATVFMLIEAVGPDVKDYKVGDVVLAYKVSQIYLRGGYHKTIFDDKEILAVIQDLPLDRLSVDGKPLKPAEDGRFALPSPS